MINSIVGYTPQGYDEEFIEHEELDFSDQFDDQSTDPETTTVFAANVTGGAVDVDDDV